VPSPCFLSIHQLEEIKENDERRQKVLEEYGLMVIRFNNEEITNELEKVMKRIEHIIELKTTNDG
jgi:very-short-patch-repair endonuclease